MADKTRVSEGKIRLLKQNNEFLFPVELWLLNDGVNRNGWRYERIRENMRKFLGTPILVAYLHGGKTIGDGHNFESETDKDGNPAPSFTGATAERIVGAIGEADGDVRMEQRNGQNWIVGRGYIFAWYAKELVNKLREYAEQGREISVSIETLVTQSRMDGPVEVEEDYAILGTTILGDHVEPAVAGAKIFALNINEREFRELKVRAASYLNQKSNERTCDTLEVFTIKQNEKLQEKFGADYKVLKAVRGEDGVIHVALCGKDYAFYRYDMGSENDTFVPANLISCAAMADLGIGENVDLSELFRAASSECDRLTAELESTRQTVTQRDNQIAAMNDRENKRRVNAAKEKAKATLAAFNANRKAKLDEACINEICAEIDNGCYTDMTNADGEWCGDSAVEDKVYSVCARKVQAEDAAAAEREKATYTYDRFNNAEGKSEGGISQLLRERGILD